MRSSSAEPVQLSRFARKREHTRRELLSAGEAVFASKGYHQAKISDIAAAADVGVGTFYLYFDCKEALFLELVRETTRRLKETLDNAKQHVTGPVEFTRVSCEEFFRFADENRDTIRILFGEGVFSGPIADAQQVFVMDVADNVAQGICEGVFAPYRPDAIAQAIIGMLTHVVSWWIMQDDVSLDEVVDTTNRFIQSGLLSRPETTAGRS